MQPIKFPRKELTHVLKWVEHTLDGEANAPWEWYQYMKLREVVGLILHGVDPLSPREGEHVPGREPPTILQLVDKQDQVEAPTELSPVLPEQ
jgi:hypothetical protein